MFRYLVALSVILLVSPAFAQQQSDPAFVQRIIGPLQQQRNNALDAAAVAQARADQLAEELEKLKAQLAAKEPKPDK
jgi:hypothetical protein